MNTLTNSNILNLKNALHLKWVWIPALVFEMFLGCAAIMMPQYIIPIFIGTCVIIFLTLLPEFSYILAILTLSNQLYGVSTATSEHLPFNLKFFEGAHSNIKALPFLVTDVFMLITFISWILAKWAKIRGPYLHTPIDTPAKFFFLWIALSSLWATSLRETLIESIPLLGAFFGLYLSVNIIRTKKMFQLTIGAFIFIGVVNAIVAIVSLYCREHSYLITKYNSFALAFNWNTIAGARGYGLCFPQCTAHFLNLSIVLSLGLLLQAKGIKKIIFLLFIILILVTGHLTTISKGGFIGLIAGLIFFFINYKPLKGYLMTSFVLTIITIIVLFPLARFNEVGKILTLGVARNIQSGSPTTATRLFVWKQTFPDVWDKTFGQGYGIGQMVPAHNIFFSVFFELGIVGFLIWLWLLIKFFYRIRTVTEMPIDSYYRTMLISLAAGIVAILSFGLVDLVYFDEITWTFFGIGMALINLANRSVNLHVQKTFSRFN